jgi:hypothetical protein
MLSMWMAPVMCFRTRRFYRELWICGRQLMKRYDSIDETFPKMWNFFKDVMHR